MVVESAPGASPLKWGETVELRGSVVKLSAGLDEGQPDRALRPAAWGFLTIREIDATCSQVPPGGMQFTD